MNAIRVWKSLSALRSVGPYLLIELLLPGGTLVAFLLWLAQRINRGGLGGMQRFSLRQKSRPAIEARPHQATYASPLDPLGAVGR